MLNVNFLISNFKCHFFNFKFQINVKYYNCQIHLSSLSSEKESNNDSVGNWNNEKGETIEMEDSPLTSTDLISLEKEAL